MSHCFGREDNGLYHVTGCGLSPGRGTAHVFRSVAVHVSHVPAATKENPNETAMFGFHCVEVHSIGGQPPCVPAAAHLDIVNTTHRNYLYQ